jgi:hypothetical protein
MTSQIISETIDQDFPVSGQDNDSQGFRDNFNAIKNALSTAASEITVLQNTTAKLGSDENSDFLGGQISNVKLNNAYRVKTLASNNLINVPDGFYFILSKSENTPITINWPDNEDENFIEIMIEIINGSTGPINISFLDSKTNFNNLLEGLEAGETAIFKAWLADIDPEKANVQFIDKFA